jgi:LysM repeat protein
MTRPRPSTRLVRAVVLMLLLLLASAPQGQRAIAQGATYTVRTGDTLSGIALQYGTTVDAIMHTNGLASSNIYIGQVLKLPGAGAGSAPAVQPALPPAGGNVAASSSGVYVVQSGDTLFGIATRRFGMDVGTLAAANGLTTNSMVYVGQRLVIPGHAGAVAPSAPAAPSIPAAPAYVAAAGSQYYVVRRGDTLTGIAAAHGVSLGVLAQVNNLLPNAWVYEGQRLLLPGGAIAAAPRAAFQVPAYAASQAQGHYHVVRSGEHLAGICVVYGTSVDVVARANYLNNPNQLYAGQRLLIPGYKAGSTGYQPGYAPQPSQSYTPQYAPSQSYAPQQPYAPPQSYEPQQTYTPAQPTQAPQQPQGGGDDDDDDGDDGDDDDDDDRPPVIPGVPTPAFPFPPPQFPQPLPTQGPQPTATQGVPPTFVPPTSVPPTSVPPTSVPPTSVPPTSVPPTPFPTEEPYPYPFAQAQPSAALALAYAPSNVGGGGSASVHSVGRLTLLAANKASTVRSSEGGYSKHGLSFNSISRVFAGSVLTSRQRGR